MHQTIQISTPAHNDLYDITRQVEAIVAESKVKTGMVNVYVQGATAGIMIQLYMIDHLFNNVTETPGSKGYNIVRDHYSL